MNCADNYNEVLLYLKQAESDINEAFENASFKKKVLPKIEENIPLKDSLVERTQEEDKTPDSDPEDIHLNFQLLLEVNEAIRSDLSELLAKHNLNDFNEDDFSDYKFRRNSSSLSRYKDLNGYHQDDSGVSANGFHFDDDEKCFSEMDVLSDLGSHSPSTISTVHVATQTTPSPSASSTNLSWVSSSDAESSEGDAWASKQPRWTSGKSNSAPVLEKVSPSLTVSRQTRSQSDRHLAEIEAAEACKWLRATGFPQYAQMYEDMLFPVDLQQAELDHARLDKDIMHSLFRRLTTLNNCVHLHQQRVAHSDESDEEQVALSDNWTYQSDMRRWSRNASTSKGAKSNIDEINRQLEVLEPDKSTRESPKRSSFRRPRKRNDGRNLEVNHASDSEISPKNQSKPRANSFDKHDPPCFYAPVEDVPCHFKTNTSGSYGTSGEACALPDYGVSFYDFPAHKLQIMRKLAMLKLTAIMEKHCPSHRSGFNWDLSKFLRKKKTPVYEDKNVFGVPISITLQRTGRLLPRIIVDALHWLEKNGVDQVGIFRKPGVKSRINALKDMVETQETVDFSEQQPYDVADMVKLYFRELPDVLMTNKLSETFITIFQHVPEPQRRDSVRCALLLLPNEHLEVMKILLRFLLIIAEESDVNQMNQSNLAMCFAPSLFQYSQNYNKTVPGAPHPKELADNKAGFECLLYLMTDFDNLLKVPYEIIKQCGPCETKAKLFTHEERDMKEWHSYLKECEANLFKEAKEKSKNWIIVPSLQPDVELAYRKVADGIPLRLWKVSIEVEAPPSEVLHRVLRERHFWDTYMSSGKIVAQLDVGKEVFHFLRGYGLERPQEEYCLLRAWRTDLYKDSCLLVETSAEHPDAPPSKKVKSLILANRFLIEPCGSGKSRVLQLCRVDTMGRAPEWYHKNFGHIQAALIANLRRSFRIYKFASGPESQV